MGVAGQFQIYAVSVNYIHMPFCSCKRKEAWSLSECSTLLSLEKSWKPWFYGGFSSQERGLESTFIFVTNPTMWPCHWQSHRAHEQENYHSWRGGYVQVMVQASQRLQCVREEYFLRTRHPHQKQRQVKRHDSSRPYESQLGFSARESMHIIQTTFRCIAFTTRRLSI